MGQPTNFFIKFNYKLLSVKRKRETKARKKRTTRAREQERDAVVVLLRAEGEPQPPAPELGQEFKRLCTRASEGKLIL